MANKFVFDVDGTLTPSRQNINADFQHWFLDFCYDNDVYLVTGSDYVKTIEQLGKDICEDVNTVFNCNGNDQWQHGINVQTNEWTLSETAHEWLSEELSASAFPLRTGLHFEHRPGMCNFSIVGRNANKEQRKQYVKWDEEFNERDLISYNFNIMFADLDARVGGETGIDISLKGNDKSQILSDIYKEGDRIFFFGDAMHSAGNDFPLAELIKEKKVGVCYHVSSWRETWEILKNEYSTNR